MLRGKMFVEFADSYLVYLMTYFQPEHFLKLLNMYGALKNFLPIPA
jgi:hypothetical protein